MTQAYSYYSIRPRKRYLSITTYLIIINAIFFLLAYLISLAFPNFLDYITFRPSLIIKGQFLWTFITSMFMHSGLIHLAVNMMSLFFLGSTLERLIGSKKFLIIYLVSGVFGSAFLILLYLLFSNPQFILLNIFSDNISKIGISAVGASGAIFGIAGALTLLKPKIPVYIMFIPIPMPLYLGIILILILLSLFPMVANSAHIGGLLMGLFMSYYFFLRNARVKRLYLIRSRGL